MKYKQEVKEKAVEMALQGAHLKVIQAELGPNPKATERYIVKAHKNGKCKFANYKEVLADLKKKGIVPKTVVQISKDKQEAKQTAKKEAKRKPNPIKEPKETKLE